MMTTSEAIGIPTRELEEEPVICTTGFTCRDAQRWGDRPGNFYMIGSMGLAGVFGMGVALSKPKSRVVVCDGDGALIEMGGAVLSTLNVARGPALCSRAWLSARPPRARANRAASPAPSAWDGRGGGSAWCC